MISQIIITGLFIWGIYYATRVKWSDIEQKFTQKEIFWFVKWYGDKWLSEWITKPLYDCPMCMASVHSVALAALFFGFTWNLLLIIPAVCGFNYVLNRVMYSEE